MTFEYHNILFFLYCIESKKPLISQSLGTSCLLSHTGQGCSQVLVVFVKILIAQVPNKVSFESAAG